jgi:hypothetical protein
MESVDTGAVDTGSLEGAASAAEQDLQGVENELQDQSQQQKKQTAEQKALAKFKVKVDGQEVEVDENELKRSYAHAKAAAKRMEEAAELRKSYQRQIQIAEGFEKWIDNVKNNPEALFGLAEQLGLDVDEIAMKRAAERLKYEYMDEDQRRAYDNERELRRYKDMEQRQAELQRQQAEQAYIAKARETVESEFVDFFTEQGVRPTPTMLARIAELKLGAAAAGRSLSMADAFKRVQAEHQKARLEMLANLSDEDIKALPKESLQKLRQTDMRQYNAGRRPTAQSASTPQVKKPMSTDDFFAMKDKQFSKR